MSGKILRGIKSQIKDQTRDKAKRKQELFAQADAYKRMRAKLWGIRDIEKRLELFGYEIYYNFKAAEKEYAAEIDLIHHAFTPSMGESTEQAIVVFLEKKHKKSLGDILDDYRRIIWELRKIQSTYVDTNEMRRYIRELEVKHNYEYVNIMAEYREELMALDYLETLEITDVREQEILNNLVRKHGRDYVAIEDNFRAEIRYLREV